MTDQDPTPEPQPAPAPEPTPEPAPEPTPAPAPNPEPTPEPADSNWRDKLAGDDESLRKSLDRFNSEGDVAKSWLEMRKKMDSGEYKRNVDFNPEWSDDEKGQWKKENNVPENHDGYTMPEGLVVGEGEQPVIDRILSAAAAGNVPKDSVAPIIDEYYKIQNEGKAAEIEAEKQFAVDTEEALRAKWGPEYITNNNMAEEFATQNFGEDVGKAIMDAGPEAVEAIARIAREINPAMTLVPNSGTPNQAISDELAILKKEIGSPAWFKDQTKQDRYQQLVSAQGKMKDRG